MANLAEKFKADLPDTCETAVNLIEFTAQRESERGELNGRRQNTFMALIFIIVSYATHNSCHVFEDFAN